MGSAVPRHKVYLVAALWQDVAVCWTSVFCAQFVAVDAYPDQEALSTLPMHGLPDVESYGWFGNNCMYIR